VPVGDAARYSGKLKVLNSRFDKLAKLVENGLILVENVVGGVVLLHKQTAVCSQLPAQLFISQQSR
jgi:hypothetical protein